MSQRPMGVVPQLDKLSADLDSPVEGSGAAARRITVHTLAHRWEQDCIPGGDMTSIADSDFSCKLSRGSDADDLEARQIRVNDTECKDELGWSFMICFRALKKTKAAYPNSTKVLQLKLIS